MKNTIKKIIAGAVAFGIATQPAQAALLTLAKQPIYLGAAIPPVVMLNVGRDHQLHYKAYTDYSDLDGDGVLDTTYKHTITYYGYFDSFKCYNYNTTNSRFEPFAVNTNKYCEGANAGKWSGNFLNWVSMTRIDAVRKLLYGGLRSTDTATLTVLERSYLPPEAHSFAKYYAGKDQAGADDFHKLTPFTSADVRTSTNPTTSVTVLAIGSGSKTFTVLSTTNLAPLAIGDAVRATAAAAGNVMIGRVTGISGLNVTIDVDANTGFTGSGTHASWTVENLTQVGVSFCNVTMGATSGANQLSQTNTNPPLLKVARGNFSLWSSMERFQCHWGEDTSSPIKGGAFAGTRWNGNIPSASGIFSSAGEPTDFNHGLGSGNYIVRVQACVAGLLGTEKCKEYNTNNSFKPIGLVQTYGEPGLLRFGLMTGSYAKNLSGGVLRKNPGPIFGSSTTADEIAADGTFLAAPAAGHVIHTLNRLRLYGYDYVNGEYGNDGCGVFAFNTGSASASRSVFSEGNCSTWGNPMSEIYLESLRYFAGASAQNAFTYTSSGSKDAALGLPLATWNNGSTFLSNSNYCTPLNVLNFNAAVASFDRDQFSGTAALAGTPDAVATTNTVGGHEGINGRSWMVGKLYMGPNATPNNATSGFEICTEKNVDGLGHVAGICSEAPAIEGSYLMAGLAHYAKTNRIRSDLTAVPATDTKSLKVTTYGITLSSNIPQIRFRDPANPSQTLAVLLPSYRPQDTSNPTGFGGGGLVDFKVVPGSLVPATGANTGIEKGRYYVNWEVSQHGADYDSDAWGVISYCVKTSSNSCGNLTATSETVGNITITTDLVSIAASGTHGFGYVISGTNADGAHYHSGSQGTNGAPGFSYSYGGVPECTDCQITVGGTSRTYRPQGGASLVLQDPLYYAAKYGGFKDSNSNDIPDLSTEWDQLRSDGSPGADGNPDNYFLVSNPLGLENALNKVFLTILQTSSASSVATNSTSLQAGTKLYQARFNSNDWSGQVLAFPVNSDGTVSATPDWDAGELMNPNLTPTFNPGNRVIITNTKGVSGSSPRGVALRWPSNPASPTTAEITSAMVTELNKNPATSTNDGRGSARLDWLRGVATNEGTAAGDFRRRQISKLGDIVNSNPNFVGPPNAGHGDAAYAAFRLLHTVTTPRTPIVYAASNDGMLHGFNASNDTATRGREVLAFMPSKALLKANKLTNQNYVHEYFVDGSPEVQDVCTTPHGATQTCTAWATYLAGSQGFGGQGIFMLDVTSPTTFTEANAQSIVKWEFTDADDADLGYSPGTPLIRRMANGKWAVIISGGYNNSEADGAASTTGYGVIFILFTSGPTGANGTWTPNVDYIKLTTAAGSVATPNGLAQPFSADINTDGIIDFLYAGDLLGNLWKFDVRSTTATTWAAAASRVALFQARDASNNVQPITASAEGTSHVTGNGFMINFGTGKYLENTDVSPPGPTPYLTQSYYGIWDQNDNANVSLQSTVTRSQLLQQQVLANVTTSAGVARVMSNNLPNWTDTSSPPLHKGWYMDFPGTTPPTLTPTTGERAVFQPTLINGRLIFTTLVPSTATCSAGGQSFLMVLDNMTGGRFAQSPFDTTGDGTINSSDLVTYGGQTVAVSGVATGTGGIAGTPTVIKAGTGVGGTVSTAGQYAGGTTGSVATMGISSYWEAYLSLSTASVANVLLDLGSNSLGRLNWREVTAD